MKHRILLWFAVFALLLSACAPALTSTGESKRRGAGKISVVATIFPPYDFARQIAGGMAEVTMLLPPGAESHTFEPAARDIRTIENSDVFIHIGGQSDEWVRRILSSMDSGPGRVVTLMDSVEPLPNNAPAPCPDGPEPCGSELCGHIGDTGGFYDEHIWTSPRNAKLMVEKISGALAEADPDNAALFRQNTENYLQALDELDRTFQHVADNAHRDIVVFGDRFPFRYLFEAYGLRHYAAFPGCAVKTEPSMQTIAFLIDTIRREEVPVVFHVELSNRRVAEAISEATGARLKLLHSCHNVTRDEFQAGAGYADLMAQNALALEEALR